MFGALAALTYGAFSVAWAKAAILGLEVGFVFWATWAVFQIVVEVAIHGLNRYGMAQSVEKGKMKDIAGILRKPAPDTENS